jgi:exodeoxyribonuclease-3
MKIISCNVNGIRSAYKKGLLAFIGEEKPDVICFQEVKAVREDLPQDLPDLKGYYLFFNPAKKRGYSGVAVFTKEKPVLVKSELGLQRFDGEGRILELQFSDFTLINLYLPHGGRQKENLGYKLESYKKLFGKLKRLENKNLILIGDFNIAHREIDLARPMQNMNNIMFTPEERKQIDRLLNLGFVDTFRQFNSKPGNYTWWPYAFEAKERNMGWRIDYCFVSKGMSKTVSRADIYPDKSFSDHCPIGVNLDI